MRAQDFLAEIATSVGRRYQEIYTQHYKQAHRQARKELGMDNTAADTYAKKSLDRYKDRIRAGEWDPIAKTRGQGRAEYKVSEAKQDAPDLMQGFRDFLPLALKVLELDGLPSIKLRHSLSHDEQSSFGRYVPDEDTVYLAVENRNVIDVLRTLAHELVHYRQDTECQLDASSGETGSPEENEANQMAGVVMRHFNKTHPEYFNDEAVDLI